MKILVCIKQVPDTTEIKIDPVTNTLIRTGVPSIMNPFDAYAVEQALRLKEESGGHVTVVTMGPPQIRRFGHVGYQLYPLQGGGEAGRL